jgi:hypothetical protein
MKSGKPELLAKQEHIVHALLCEGTVLAAKSETKSRYASRPTAESTRQGTRLSFSNLKQFTARYTIFMCEWKSDRFSAIDPETKRHLHLSAIQAKNGQDPIGTTFRKDLQHNLGNAEGRSSPSSP